MTTNLFSSYRQGENRVTATFMAVLQRLSLPNIDRILGALLGETDFSLVTFINQPRGKDSTPDAKIKTGDSIVIETKTKPNEVDTNQVKRHLESVRDGEILLLLTPDDDKPKDLPDVVVWSNFSTLSEAVGEILDDEDAPPSEREAFLLREFNSMLWAEGLISSAKSRVVVVAAKIAWQEYEEHSVYACLSSRSFRPSEHIAFYVNGKIETVIPRIKSVIQEIVMTQEEQIESLKDDYQRKLAKELLSKIKHHPKFSEWEAYHRVMFLTGPDDGDTVKLKGPIINDKKDKNEKPTPFTMGQPRYVTLESLQKASKTSELEHC